MPLQIAVVVKHEIPRARPASLLEAPHLFKRLALARGEYGAKYHRRRRMPVAAGV